MIFILVAFGGPRGSQAEMVLGGLAFSPFSWVLRGFGLRGIIGVIGITGFIGFIGFFRFYRAYRAYRVYRVYRGLGFGA